MTGADAVQAASEEFRSDGVFFPVIRYAGGEEDPTAVPMRIFVSPQGIEVDVPPDDSPGTRIPWAEVRDVAIDGPDTAERRVTASRALFLGALALAFPVTEGLVFLDIETVSGETHEYAIEDVGAAEVRSWFRPYRQYMTRAAQGASAADVEARLAVLDDLRASGTVTAEEYAAKRAEILDLI